MENQIKDLFEKAKKNKKTLVMLKNTAVAADMLEFAAELRDIEVKNFPVKKADKKILEEISKFGLVLRMMGLSVDCNQSLGMMYLGFQKYSTMKGKFSVKEAVEIKIQVQELFIDRENLLNGK